MEGEKNNKKTDQPLLLDFSADDANRNNGVEAKSSVVDDVTVNHSDGDVPTNDVTKSDLFLHVQYCLSRALEGVSLDNMSQVFAVVNNPTDHLISLDQSNKSCLRDELIAILHQQVSWYHCSGQDREMLLLQNLLQQLDLVPANKLYRIN